MARDIETNPKAPKFKVNNWVRITKTKNIFSKGYTENWSREILFIDCVLKTNPLTCEIKDINEEKIIESFHENELWVSYKQLIQNQSLMLDIKSK